MSLSIKPETKYFNYLVWTTVIITVVMTPWVNSDSLIIPKFIVLFSLGLSLLPFVLANSKKLTSSLMGRALFVTTILIVLQMLMVIWMSPAPFEQQFFGRTGRGLGFGTEFALLFVILTAALCANNYSIPSLQVGMFFASFITTLYSIFQRLGYDVFDWTSRTNGIIGTLGNPNFQSSFAAMAFLPTLTYFWTKKYGRVLAFISATPLITLIYISESTQGYIILLATLNIFLLFYFWFKNKVIFNVHLIVFLASVIVAILGMINKGPLASYLYKVSVQSRGDFFRTSLAIANEHPFFGVGLDSLGDNYLKFWNPNNTSSIGEFADNSHNLFLNYASTGGYTLAVLHYILVALVLFSFIFNQRKIKLFSSNYIALFCAWLGYQLQAMISPANISMLTWNAILSGFLIGLSFQENLESTSIKEINPSKLEFVRPFMYFFGVIALIITYPLYRVDSMQVTANKTGNANLAMESALSYPESTIRYARIGQELLKSNLLPQALEIARAAAKFNPDAPSAWALILLNNSAPLSERIDAKNQVLRLDPYNREIRDVNFSDLLDPGK